MRRCTLSRTFVCSVLVVLASRRLRRTTATAGSHRALRAHAAQPARGVGPRDRARLRRSSPAARWRAWCARPGVRVRRRRPTTRPTCRSATGAAPASARAADRSTRPRAPSCATTTSSPSSSSSTTRIRLRRPYQLKHVGDDEAYGGAGAWWTRSKGQLVAYADKRILRVRARPTGRRRDARVARGAPSGGSASLARRPHDDLVDAHVRRARDGVEDRVGDVLRLEHLADLLARASPSPAAPAGRCCGPGARCRRSRARQRSRARPACSASWRSASEKRVHAELGHVVDGGAGVGAAARHRRHVDDVPSPAARDQRQRGVGADQQAPQVHVDHAAPLARSRRRPPAPSSITRRC